jgi:hypothetical protein
LFISELSVYRYAKCACVYHLRQIVQFFSFLQ